VGVKTPRAEYRARLRVKIPGQSWKGENPETCFAMTTIPPMFVVFGSCFAMAKSGIGESKNVLVPYGTLGDP